MFPDLRPIGRIGYPSGVAIVDACAGGCVLKSDENPPKNTCYPGFVAKCYLSKFLLRVEIRDQKATYL